MGPCVRQIARETPFPSLVTEYRAAGALFAFSHNHIGISGNGESALGTVQSAVELQRFSHRKVDDCRPWWLLSFGWYSQQRTNARVADSPRENKNACFDGTCVAQWLAVCICHSPGRRLRCVRRASRLEGRGPLPSAYARNIKASIVVRLFQVYYPVRSLVLLAGETVVACSSFLVATFIALGITSTASFESSPAYKLLAPVAVAILCSHLFDLYSVRGLLLHGEIYVRVFLAQSTMAFLLAGLEYVWPELLPDNWVLLIGAVIFSIAIVGWRYGFTRLMQHAYLRQRVYVLGGGSLASELIKTIREHHNLGFEIVGW